MCCVLLANIECRCVVQIPPTTRSTGLLIENQCFDYTFRNLIKSCEIVPLYINISICCAACVQHDETHNIFIGITLPVARRERRNRKCIEVRPDAGRLLSKQISTGWSLPTEDTQRSAAVHARRDLQQ